MGPEHFDAAVEHARAAAPFDHPELATMLCDSGRLALTAGDHETASSLLQSAADLQGADPDDDPGRRAHLLIDLASAEDGCGRVGVARDLLNEAVRVAQAAGENALVVDAAIRSAFPPDWRAGDRRTAALLALAESLEGDGERSAAVLAARGMVEMRIPTGSESDHQIAWVTRASVAQPLTERALESTHGTSSPDRLVALIAWRSTHRAPSQLEDRLAVSHEAVDLAQRLLEHDRLVDASVHLAVDALEAGRRSEYDRSVATVRWAATTGGNPRLSWWAATVSAGAALLDGDPEMAARFRVEADEIGARSALPGWVSAELLLAAETALTVDDEAELITYLVPPDEPLLASPIVRSTVAYVAARLGETDRAAAEAELALRAVDEESSYLLCLTLLARTAARLPGASLAAGVRERLLPWRGRVAVDASGWWCSGPVDLALAELELAHSSDSNDDGDAARELLEAAESLIRSIGDVRSAATLERLRSVLTDSGSSSALAPQSADRAGSASVVDNLTDRERRVLALLATGRTNAAIGAELSFSPSTIRAETVSIYRKLGVNGRVEATAIAVAAGLAATTTT